MRLYIAEKPSLGKAIAENLPGVKSRDDGFIRVGTDVVTWAHGHILELAPPEAYNPAWKSWNTAVNVLPYPIECFKLLPKPDSKAQLRVIQSLLSQATEVVNAGDPDREGQMLIDEILESSAWKGPTLRLLINATDPVTVKKALSSMRPNSEFFNLYQAAKCRSEADWIIGMNLTVAATKLLANDELVSVGRVQTPTLALVVRRDEAIEKFGARPFFSLEVTLETPQGPIVLTYNPSDESKRIWSEVDAKRIVEEVKKRQSVTVTVTTGIKKESPPRLFMLRTFQGECNSRYGWSASKALELAQSLYDSKHQLASYPRTDCEYMPAGQANDALTIAQHIVKQTTFTAFAPLLSLAVPRASIYDSSKVTEHHALTPTVKSADFKTLTADEQKAWLLLAERFLMSLLPSHQIEETVVSFSHGEIEFSAKGEVSLNMAQSWRALAPHTYKPLPQVADGATLQMAGLRVVKGKTTPPKRYTEKTLLDDMSSVAKYVEDPKLKAILKETSGIGTAATQAKIIETLKERGYVAVKNRELISTPFGRAVVHGLPERLTDPCLTALWEDALGLIAAGGMKPGDYMLRVRGMCKQLVDDVRDSVGKKAIVGDKELVKNKRAKLLEQRRSQQSSSRASATAGLPL